jgi:hypothetical protein
MQLIDSRVREDVDDAVDMLVQELSRVQPVLGSYATMLEEMHPYWASPQDVKDGLAINRKYLDTLAGYLLYYIHADSMGGRGGMAPQIKNDVVWFKFPNGLLDPEDELLDVDCKSLAELVRIVTVESVLLSLETVYDTPAKRKGTEVDILPGDKNPRCWNITSNEFSFAVGLLLHVLCTNPFCSAGTEYRSCATILDSNARGNAVLVRSC